MINKLSYTVNLVYVISQYLFENREYFRVKSYSLKTDGCIITSLKFRNIYKYIIFL